MKDKNGNKLKHGALVKASGDLWKAHGWQDYFETKKFLKSIEGKIVDLVFTCNDAFEKNDNNYWLPDELFTVIKHCWEGGSKEMCDCPDCGSTLVDYKGE